MIKWDVDSESFIIIRGENMFSSLFSLIWRCTNSLSEKLNSEDFKQYEIHGNKNILQQSRFWAMTVYYFQKYLIYGQHDRVARKFIYEPNKQFNPVLDKTLIKKWGSSFIWKFYNPTIYEANILNWYENKMIM
jgi:hypothetical protein